MEFIWNDGGRSACGFVGLAGDCVTRAIAIATGLAYRHVYDALGRESESSPRNGMSVDVASEFLTQKNWQKFNISYDRFEPTLLPMGVVIVHLVSKDDPFQHFCTMIDQVIHDTWNPSEEEDYVVSNYWTCVTAQSDCRLPASAPLRPQSNEQLLTQQAFDKILNRLRALDRTASNGASTEGEKHNAIRMMQDLMLRHNLTREDIVDDVNVESVLFTRMACPLNGRRSCTWELNLAAYVIIYVFPSTQWYYGTRAHRTLVWFYGPKSDVENAIALYKELILTIATASRLQFGGYARGSGASYCEGYVQGLPRNNSSYSGADSDADSSEKTASQSSLILQRTVALKSVAKEWLAMECNIQLSSGKSAGRYQHDEAAMQRGQLHGSQHEISASKSQQRLTHKQSGQ